jgi:hypothetical protein
VQPVAHPAPGALLRPEPVWPEGGRVLVVAGRESDDLDLGPTKTAERKGEKVQDFGGTGE